MVFKGYHKENIFKIIKQNSITFLSWSSWKLRIFEHIFENIFEYIPGQNLDNAIHYEFLIFI